MYGIALAALKKYLAPLGVALLIVLSLLGYGQTRRRQGYKEKATEDLKEISEHVEDKRTAERRIRDVPVAIGERRSRLRAQRDKLKKLL